jgi:hypothetical protein
MRRLFLALTALALSLTGWLFQSPAAALSGTDPTHAYIYDGLQRPMPTTHNAPRRGPPAAYGYTTYDTVDRRSHGIPARPETVTRPVIHIYDHPATLSQAAGVGPVAGGPTGVAPATPSSSESRHVAAKTGDEGLSAAYHYTRAQNVASIESKGLLKGGYATPDGSLSPLQAQIDLALPPNRGLPGALVRVDVAGLRSAGYEIPQVSQVGRSFGMPGGGYEMQFPYAIPSEFLKVIR